MTYEMHRFSTQSFERFVQALATKILGPKIQIFGVGSDGAREATYNGHCRIADEDWNGYLVIQAKCRISPGPSASNAKWLKKQIDYEMAKFADKRRALTKPDYYLLASNVTLSASARNSSGKGMGGVDQVTEHLNKWANNLGIKGIHLWHAGTLSSLIDVHEEIRKTFSVWIQPSDVLSALLRNIGTINHEEILFRYLRNSISRSRDIKTRDVGQTTGRTLVLDEVFIDLPIDYSSPDQSPIFESNSIDEIGDELSSDTIDENPSVDSNWDTVDLNLRPKIVATLMLRAADRFDRHNSASFKRRSQMAYPLSNRIVLLGGPGQGKSTIGQYLAQLCRARLLDTTREFQSPEMNLAVQAIIDRSISEKISISGPLRYPLHVELARFADALEKATGKGENLTILGHLANHVSQGSEEKVTGSVLRRWLGEIPSIIILDGLDEVSHGGNRAEVITAINDLMDDIHEADADSLIFLTSRPQGYQDDLSRKHWAHWTLEPLRSEEAIDFAERLAPILVSDEARQEEIIEIMRSAATDNTTSPLMISPLQVMLLFQLVALHNNIPKDRWTLFNRNYEILRDREIAKGGDNGRTIGQYKTQIDRIHYDAGYLLHVRAEAAGGANPYFTIEEFSKLIEDQLLRDGFDENLQELTASIVKVATNRLVFLGCRTEGQVAFDVRSLQEFMAAARITTSPEIKIRERLNEIAGRAHWLHVFKIACSKLYASASHEVLRETVISLVIAHAPGGSVANGSFFAPLVWVYGGIGSGRPCRVRRMASMARMDRRRPVSTAERSSA